MPTSPDPSPPEATPAEATPTAVRPDPPDGPPSPGALRRGLAEVTLADERRLGRRIDQARKQPDPERRAAALRGVAEELEVARRRLAARRESAPVPSYPPDLPITGRREDILAAIRDHQVVVVAGETGSGKTTQLPKMCLELGRGQRGMIGHTQPRRIAARTVADRIAEELGTQTGGPVGYQVRFTGRVGDQTLVKVMTDGILLSELQRDRMLRRYDTIIIDEAHERSLNIDFILGYLKQLLPRRPDLKLIITSATIDPERFARHFGADGTPAPIIEVSGRTYPVEVRYRPILPEGDDEEDPADADRDQTQAIGDAVDELTAEGPGDILVFLSGEREIRDTADALRDRLPESTEILPLYARLSSAEQHRVFQPHAGRRVVLATNVAETSLTVPGIHYVIDPGTARVSRYSSRLKVQRLPIEAVSQASANQRKGRCGRTADGICVRLYSEQDFTTRPEFTEPEMLRTNLASVILRMAAIGLGDVAAFPFIDPPDRRAVTAGVQLLDELGALEPGTGTADRRLTKVGRALSELPVDPRLARMVMEADRNGCLPEVLVIAAALSIQDPRERPVERRAAADQQHARFRDGDSDFLSYLKLWRYLAAKQKELSGSAFRRMCRAEFLNYLRVREWQDLQGQLRQVADGLGLSRGGGLKDTEDADRSGAALVHRSLLAGLLSHIGLKDADKREYSGARNARFAVFPGSALFSRPPRWVMAAELVETSRLWARVCARIEPEWIEPLAGHLIRRTYSEPRWDAERGAVLATERVTLYGVPIVTGRTVNYGRIDPVTSREMFIRNALVEGDWRTHHAFFHANRETLDTVAELEDRTRRRDIVIDDDTLYELYDARVGADVVSARHFDTWWKKTRRTAPDLLTFTPEMLRTAAAGAVSTEDYPDSWRHDGVTLPLSYRFEPGAPDDGVTAHVPLPALGGLPAEPFGWQVPGLREELVAGLIRTLPKPLRRNFVPAPDYARAFLSRVEPTGPLAATLGHELLRMTGVAVPPDAWRWDQLPPHLTMTFRVEDDAGETLAEGKDLGALRRQLSARSAAVLAAAADDITRSGLRDWDLGELPRVVERSAGDQVVRGHPALHDDGDSVSVRLYPTAPEQDRAMAAGTRRLLLLTLPSPASAATAGLTYRSRLVLSRSPYANVSDLLRDCIDCAMDALVRRSGGPAWDAAGFARLREQVRPDLAATVTDVVRRVEEMLAVTHRIENRLNEPAVEARPEARSDIRLQLGGLIHRGFVTATGGSRLADLLRYLHAIERRIDRLPAEPDRDADRMAGVQRVWRDYRTMLETLSPERVAGEEVRQVRWMIEELRVSYFAQSLGTPYPVSEKRIERAVDLLPAG